MRSLFFIWNRFFFSFHLSVPEFFEGQMQMVAYHSSNYHQYFCFRHSKTHSRFMNVLPHFFFIIQFSVLQLREMEEILMLSVCVFKTRRWKNVMIIIIRIYCHWTKHEKNIFCVPQVLNNRINSLTLNCVNWNERRKMWLRCQ